MIEESLLFRMDYLFPDITIIDMILTLLFITFLIFFLFRNTQIKRLKPSPLPGLPLIHDPKFEEKISEYIRAFLAKKYPPEHALSHTVREVESYAKGDPLIDILRDLERVEYTSKRLSEADRGELLSRVKRAGK